MLGELYPGWLAALVRFPEAVVLSAPMAAEAIPLLHPTTHHPLLLPGKTTWVVLH